MPSGGTPADNLRLSVAQITPFLGLSRAGAFVIARRGDFGEPDADGKYLLATATKNYIRALKIRAVKGGAMKGGLNCEEQAQAEEDPEFRNLTGERARLTSAKADYAEMQRREKMGLLVPASQIEQAWLRIVVTVRRRILAISSKMAGQTFRDSRQLAQMLTEEIHAALEEIAVTKISADVPPGADQGDAEDAGGDEAAAAAHGF